MTNTHTHDAEGQSVVLSDLAANLIAELPKHKAGRCAHTIIGGSGMRAVLLALAEGSALAEHDAPGAATLQVVVGNVRLIAGETTWSLGAGDLIRIPPQRHSVEADSEAAFLLTVALRA
ncbi:MAG: cupin domain-containing protein [Nocardioides sp.]|nr:cupin domain-containing protein [Nocardioides sp.]